ncbi:MAG: polysaccharide biosynthesis tyrosine autokinase [Oscillatoriaceae cyanobacterium]
METHITPRKSYRDEFLPVDPVSMPERGTDLSDVGRTLRKRWPSAAAVATAVFAGVSFSTVTQTPDYQSETLILLDKKTGVSIEPTIPLQDGYTAKDLSTEIQILQSRALVSKAVAHLENSYSNLSVEDVVSNLSIRQAGDADVLIVSYTDTDPERAKAVLEVLGSTYVHYSLERQRSEATNAIGFIKEQLPEAQKELNQSASAIREFREKNGIVDPDTHATQVVGIKQSLEEQARSVEIALNRTQRKYQELRLQVSKAGQNPDAALPAAILSQDTVYQQLATQLKEIEAKYTEESSRFYDTHPVVQNLLRQRESMRQLLQYRSQRVLGSAVGQVDITDVSGYGKIQQDLAAQLLEVETELAAQNSQLQSIRKAQAEVENNFEKIPLLQQAYADLEREFKVKSEAVNRFLEKLQELQISEAQEIAPWQILEPPYLPENPVSPNIKRNLLLGLIAGGLLGIGAAILLERTDQRVKGVEEAKELTGLPTLALVPRVSAPVIESYRGQNGEAIRYGSAFTEAVRSLGLNLRYLGAKDEVKTLAFTSSTPSEGKSTLTYNLARVLAELGHRVLLVDADMRKPTVHQMIKQPNALGLSSAIATDRPWRQLIHADDSGKLHIMTSGPMPPNPVVLLESQKMSELLQEWRQVYDYVLLDTTPILGVTDAQSVATKVDSVVFVAAIERATRSTVFQSMEILARTRCHVAGLVVNMVDSEHESYYYSYYYSPYAGANGNGNGNGNGHNGNGHNGNGHNGNGQMDDAISRTQDILNDLFRRN